VTNRPERPARSGSPDSTRGRSRGGDNRSPDYIVVGHICADILPDGTAVLGGTALYSALAAATLGWRTGILTRGRYDFDLDGLRIPALDFITDRIQVIVQDAEWPTLFVNDYSSGRRTQQIPKWAGPIDLRGLPPHWRNPRVLHLGPIAQEIDVRQSAGLNPEFLGVTPQGWMRDWPRATGGRVKSLRLRLPREFVSQIDGIVVNDEEFADSRDTVEAVGRNGYGVMTLGVGGARLFSPAGTDDVPAFDVPTVDLTGAGDVFAAAFFYRIADPSASPHDALVFANAAAGLSLAGIGATRIPTRAAIRRLLDQVAQQP
jgi:sugar/nucleoside kinase (ribokinase family)